eukprot:g1455.t1
MQTPARWPNALWSDKSLLEWKRWASFDNSKPWGPSKYKKGQPITFYDSGPLSESGLDVTGAMMIGNIAHMDTFVGVVTQHAANSSSFDAKYEVDAMGNTKSSNSIYFLEGLASFVDEPSEFAYDPPSGELVLCTADGKSPQGRELRHKTQAYAFNISNSPHLHLANLSLFGTTINARGGIPRLQLSSIEFNFPSFSRRMLGDIRTAVPTVISAAAGADAAASGALTARGKPVNPADSSFNVFNCSWIGADGTAVDYFGTHGNWTNNLFRYNDWTGADTDNHRGMGSTVLLASMGSHDVFVRNTLYGNGPSVGYGAGAATTSVLNRCERQADISNDGACIQIRSSSAANSTLAHNWALLSAKGLRLDSGSNSEFVPDERNNTIHGNVAMWTNGFELKNDFNFYTANLALWPPPFPLHGSAATEVLRVDNSRFKGENAHSIVQSNVASSWLTPLAGVTSNNVLDKDVGAQLRDPANYDFRPIKGSAVAKQAAGPYPYVEPESQCEYLIPGRQARGSECESVVVSASVSASVIVRVAVNVRETPMTTYIILRTL